MYYIVGCVFIFIWYIFLDRCNYYGRIYLEGDWFVLYDGCNYCMCIFYGIVCIEIVCFDVIIIFFLSVVGKCKVFNVYLFFFVFMIVIILLEIIINDYFWLIWNIFIVIVLSY